MRSLQGLARRLRIDDRVSFLGARSNTDVWDLLAASDVLVLPSGIDGWGAVANEALMSGTPVICSDYCGASDLIRDGDCGRTFRAGSIADLAAALSAWAARGPTTHARRRRIREWSRRIDGASLASYFTAIVEHVDEGAPKPVAPWHLREPSRPRRDAPAVCG
jgi:glycosyltransferase involved in cell wall biosynthesis